MITLWHNSLTQKILAVVRFGLVAIYYGARFKVAKPSLVGPWCKIVVSKGGKIRARGRIILSDHVMLYAKGSLEIGTNFNINSYSRIVSHQSISIGDNVTIGQMVSILDHDHHYELHEHMLVLDGYNTGSIVIGDHVWIGDKCTIVKGVTVGSNVVIGANSVVTKDIPSNTVIGGSPARVIKRIGSTS